MAKTKIDGTEYEGSEMKIVDGKVFIDGKFVRKIDSQGLNISQINKKGNNSLNLDKNDGIQGLSISQVNEKGENNIIFWLSWPVSGLNKGALSSFYLW